MTDVQQGEFEVVSNSCIPKLVISAASDHCFTGFPKYAKEDAVYISRGKLCFRVGAAKQKAGKEFTEKHTSQ